jgi:hypothetical protein
MKTNLSKLTIIVVTTVLFSSCAIDMLNRVTGNKNVVTQDRKINDDFTSIKVSTGLDLYITQSNNVSLRVEADENLHDIIITEIKNGVLKVYSEKNIWKAKARKVYVSVKDLEELSATSGSDIYTENTLRVSNLNVMTTSGADARITVNAENITTSSTSGSDIKIMGTTVNHTASATSGSSINSFGLKSQNVIAKVTSGANIDVYALESIDAVATSGGDIDYKGNPRQVNKKSTSGGSISAQ